MKTIKEFIEQYVASGFTDAQARSFTAQQIILSKIAESRYADKVLLKGGVVMYNITQEQRRSTLDLDFDFIRFDIGKDRNIDSFVRALNTKLPMYQVRLRGKPVDLHQQDYKGKRIILWISDSTEGIRFKMDIGVHTLFVMPQDKMCFSFQDGNKATLLVNPPEQIFAEKLYSLAKIGPTSQRFKDIDDMYYLVKNQSLKIELVRECLELLTISHAYGINDIQDVVDYVDDCLNSDVFSEGYETSSAAWMNINYTEAKTVILDFIYQL